MGNQVPHGSLAEAETSSIEAEGYEGTGTNKKDSNEEAATPTAQFELPPADLQSSTLRPAEALLSMKSLWLSEMAYNTVKSDSAKGKVEHLFMQNLDIVKFESWYAPAHLSAEVEVGVVVSSLDADQNEAKAWHFMGGAQAISGVIENVPILNHNANGEDEKLVDIEWGRYVFLSFRGTQSASDREADKLFLLVKTLKSNKGKTIGNFAFGAVAHFNVLRALQRDKQNMLERAVEQARQLQCRILITGHSLGGAMATLCAAALAEDYPDVPITLVTFGSPKVCDKDAAAIVNRRYKIPHLRFVNKDDLVTVLGEQGLCDLKHTGHFVYHPGGKDWAVYRDEEASNFPCCTLAATVPLALSFAGACFSPHHILAPGGYFDKLADSRAYALALQSAAAAAAEESSRDTLNEKEAVASYARLTREGFGVVKFGVMAAVYDLD